LDIQKYYSNGKFLISGEYLVLKGALAFAIPLKFGQSLQVMPLINDTGTIHWKSFVKENLWFEARFSQDNLEIIETNDQEKAAILHKLLLAANQLNSETLRNQSGFEVISNINFDIAWGLGSSSSLLSNIAHWFDVDPMVLHHKTSKGSGFDVACARAGGPILYQLSAENAKITPVTFDPEFRDQIFFVYLGKKQQSDRSIKCYHNLLKSRESEIEQISELTEEIVFAHSLSDFDYAIKEHEKIISKVLSRKTIGEIRFAGYEGSVKSLGAWGGDFVMMTWQNDRADLEKYLNEKGYFTIFSFDEIVYHHANQVVFAK
jgi:mevalonate kinase